MSVDVGAERDVDVGADRGVDVGTAREDEEVHEAWANKTYMNIISENKHIFVKEVKEQETL